MPNCQKKPVRWLHEVVFWKTILDLYLRCYTLDEIATETVIPRSTVDRIVDKLISQNGDNSKMGRPESIQDYNLWEFANKQNSHRIALVAVCQVLKSAE